MNDTGADNPDTLPLLKDRAVNDEHWYVRQTAAQAIASGWAYDPDTLPWLKDRAVNDENGEGASDCRGGHYLRLAR